MRAVYAACLIVMAPLVGCIGADDVAPTGTDAGIVPCRHPYPCGTEWPAGASGPFGLLENLHVQVPSHDGVLLDGWILRPALPDGVKAPVVLISGPYWGLDFTPDRPEFWAEDWYGPVKLLVENGYAVAIMTVRGGGNSGGCFEMFGPNEQKDQAFLVEWLGTQDWSNGRVAMMGLSYLGTTPWEAAVQAPPHLKTVVVAGMVSDLYTFYHTPQGAAFFGGAGFQTYFNALVTVAPPVLGATPQAATTGHAPVVPERACPEVVRTMSTLYVGEQTDVRDGAYWSDRRLIDRFDEVTAAVLLTHGFQDAWGSGHQQQELLAWRALPASTPKHQIEGQWAHEFPDHAGIDEAVRRADWNDRLLAWYDYWLKGIGKPPVWAGTVEYADGTGAWRTTTAWPPAEARSEVLHVQADGLRPAPGGGEVAFRSAPDVVASERAAGATGRPIGPLCPAVPGSTVLAATEPLAQRIVIAGDPVAYLRITADQPGGLLGVGLVELASDAGCVDGVPTGMRPLTVGAADLRFHAGNMQGADFPTGTPTHVRVDLTNLAEAIEPGYRLALLVSHPDPGVRTSQGFRPLVTLVADGSASDSHLVLPLVEGTLGGAAPTLAYPPRPFAP